MLSITNISYPKIGESCKETIFSDDLSLEQWIVPKGTIVKIKQTKNFGYVILLPKTKDIRGFEIPKKLFRY